jgi:hypothetical protein
VDKKSDQRILVEGWNQTMSVAITDGGARAAIVSQSSIDSLSFGSSKSFLLRHLPVKSFQKLTYDMAADRLILDSLDVSLQQILLSAHGTVEHVQTTPVLDLSLQSTEADLGQLLSLVPQEMLKASQGLKTAGTFQFALSVKGEADSLHQPTVRGTFTVNNGSIQYQGLPKAITSINIGGRFDQPGGASANLPPGQFMVDRFAANLGSSNLNGNLKTVNFNDPSVSASLEGQINLAEVKDYYPLEQGTELRGGLKANVSISGKAKDPTGLKADGRIDLQNVTVQSPASERPLKNLNGTIVFNNQVIEAKALAVEIGESDLTLNFTMRNYLGLAMKHAAPSEKPSLTATLTSRQLRMADLPQAKSKPGEPEHKSEGPILPDIDINAKATIGRLALEKFQFDDVRASVRINNGIITLDNFSTNAFNGNVATLGTLNLNPATRAFDLNLDLNKLEANAALPPFTSFGKYLFGIFNLTGSMKGTLNDTLGLDPQTLTGHGKVQINQGKLTGYPLTTQLASFTGLSQLKQIEFSDWTTSFNIAQGRLELPDLKIKAGNTDILISGFQGLDGKLDYRMTLRLPPEVTNQLKIGGLGGDIINFLKDKDGKIGLPLMVGGTVTKPAFSLDQAQIQKAASQALQQQVRSQVDSTTEELKDRAKKELENLFKKKP